MTLHKAIKGYEDYLVSTDGRVYSLKSQKYLKGGKDKDGYHCLALWENGKYSNMSLRPLQYHINKGETDFSIKQRNGRTRHFKTVFTERSEV